MSLSTGLAEVLLAGERTLGISFETREALRQEYNANLANGGIFVATEDSFALREAVQVRVSLSFAGEHIVLQGEVVHVVPVEMAGAGAKPGVALALTENPTLVRDRFAPFLEEDGAAEGVSEPGGPEGDAGKRAAPRRRARVEAVIDAGGGALGGRTRDLSRSGALVGVQDDVAIGETVQLTLRHPSTGEELAVGGRVVRQVESDGTGVSAVAIQFDPEQNEQDVVERFVEDVQRIEHTRRMGGIAGPIQELGPQAVLQMFASSSPAGTLYLRNGQEEGVIGFEGSLLRMARIGSLEGMEALIQLMSWTEGSFEFHARFESSEAADAPLPLEAAMFEALRQIDEAKPVDPTRFPLRGRLCGALPAEGYDATKVEAAILDLAQAGFSIERALEVIPEADAEIFRALANLTDAGLIRVEA